MTRNSFETQKKVYQVVTSRISDYRYMNIQDGRMHNDFVSNEARYLAYKNDIKKL